MATLNRRLLATVALVVVLVGCVRQETPPELPPVSSMQADITALQAAPPEAKNANPAGTSVYTNFANAWVRVAIVTVYSTGVLLVPAAALALALTQQPHQHGNTWVWSITIGATTGELELVGNLSGWDVSFYVSNPNQGLDRFLWLEGDFELDLSAGTWLGHSVDLPAASNEVLALDWEHVSDTDYRVWMTNVNVQSADVGDTLTYDRVGNAATLVFDDASMPGNIAVIVFDVATGVGSIEVPGYNGGQKACWDAAFMNTPCP